RRHGRRGWPRGPTRTGVRLLRMFRWARGLPRTTPSPHFTAPGESMRSVAAALIVVAGGAVVAGVSARREAVAAGDAEPLAATVRTAVTTARETVRRRIRSRSAAAVPAGGPDAA